jgi:hypothetical protein
METDERANRITGKTGSTSLETDERAKPDNPPKAGSTSFD